MAKRVRAAEPLGVKINETELGALRRLSEGGETCRVCSISELAQSVGKSVATIRNSLRALEGEGLVVVHARFLRNGGQLENEYEVTALGERVLRTCLSSSEACDEG